MIRNWRRSSVLRKGAALLQQAPRAWSRLMASPEDYGSRPTALANSFPKSGTHLLLQVVEALPGIRTYGSFLASTPSIRFRERSVRSHLRLIRAIAPGEALPGHLFYAPVFADALGQRNCVHYFIYRDLRDVVISEAHYLTHMNRWHRMHRHFRYVLRSTEERISAAILGVDRGEGAQYPDIGARFARYQGWLSRLDVLAIRFEDLIAEPERVVRAVVDRFGERQARGFDVNKACRRALASIAPERSHTFREGRSGGWKGVLTGEHRRQMKDVAGGLLIDLGYATDLDW